MSRAEILQRPAPLPVSIISGFPRENNLGLSFETISGYGPHGAIVHYAVTAETDIPLEPGDSIWWIPAVIIWKELPISPGPMRLGPLTQKKKNILHWSFAVC